MADTRMDPQRLLAERYLLGPVLGVGGMGEVRRGRDVVLDRDVAIKSLRGIVPGNLERLRREASAVSRLGHPNIVSAFEFVDDGDVTALVMEYVEGQSLRQILESAGALRIGEAAALIEQLLDGLAAVHRIGIIHRDLKPENLLIDASGRLRIVDFGLAAVPGEHRLTSHGAILGTPEYMAPERLRASAPAPGDDVYAVGVLFYELVCGVPPITGETPVSIIAEVLRREGEAIDCSALGPFAEFVAACLQSSPESRPRNAEAAMELFADHAPEQRSGIRDGDEEVVVVAGGMAPSELLGLLPPQAVVGQVLEGDLVFCARDAEAIFQWLQQMRRTQPPFRAAMSVGAVVGRDIGVLAGGPVGRAARLIRLARAGDVLLDPVARSAIGLGFRSWLSPAGTVHYAGANDAVIYRVRQTQRRTSLPVMVGPGGQIHCGCGEVLEAPGEQLAAPARIRCGGCGSVVTVALQGPAFAAQMTQDVLRLDQQEDSLLRQLGSI